MRLRIIRLTAENGLEYTFWFLFDAEENELAIPPEVEFEPCEYAVSEDRPV